MLHANFIFPLQNNLITIQTKLKRSAATLLHLFQFLRFTKEMEKLFIDPTVVTVQNMMMAGFIIMSQNSIHSTLE